MKKFALCALALAACGQTQNGQPSSNAASEPVNALASETPPIPSPATGPDAKTPLAEPKGPIDSRSVEAAGQVVQHYDALIEQHRLMEAAGLWGSTERASDFALQLKRYPETHLEIGKPGEPEGAAGSVYVTVPVTFYGKDQNGAAFRRGAEITLRRVNDVPGSSQAQRRWHIERIDWKD